MLILLPPSEGKAPPPRRGTPVDLDRLSTPELTATRRTLLDALVATSSRSDAAALLGLTPSQAEDLERNRRLLHNPARPAGSVYTGVLYDALDLAGLPAAAKRRATRSVRIQSALWGPITPADRIPPYRLSISTTLPGVGGLAAFWRRALEGTVDRDDSGLVVDCRSSGYASAWRPSDRGGLVRIDPVTDVGGARRAVSHFAKHTRGVVARRLLLADRRPRTPQQLADLVGSYARCELTGSAAAGWRLQVITDPQGRLGQW